MEFAHPHLLWLLALTVAGLSAFLVWSWRRRQQLMQLFIQARLLAFLTVRVSPRRHHLRQTLLVTAVALLFLTLARPRWGYGWEEARQRGLDIVVAIDTSRSMLAEDVQPNRLGRARLAALDLLRLAKSDRLGLVAYAGSAFLQCPLTLDDEAFRQSLEALDTSIIPQGGTALAGAIEAALAAFKDESNFKILVLISDGEDHDPGALAEAQKAAAQGLRIFTLGVGTPRGEVLRVKDENGAPAYVKDDSGQVVKSRLNEALLQQVATAAQGFYLPLAAPRVVETLYEKGLAPLPKTEVASRLVQQYQERYQWPLALAILLLLLEAAWPAARKEKAAPSGTPKKTSASAGSTRGARAAAASIAGALLFAATARADQGLEAYRAGRFEQARREYLRRLQQRPDDPQLHYNAGTAAYALKDYTAAARAFTNSLTAPDLPLQQRSFYNLGNTLFQLGDQAPELQTKRQRWEEALKSFDAALQLDPKDTDAQDNKEFVQRQIELLKQQQQQQQQEKPQPGKPDKDQDSSQQSSSGQQNQPDPKQEPSPKPEDAAKKDGSPKPGEAQPKPQDQQPQPQEGQPGKPEPQPQPSPSAEKPPTQPAGSETGKDGQEQGAAGDQEAAAAQAGEMTPQQARQLLDSQKSEERALIFLQPRTNQANAHRFKDW